MDKNMEHFFYMFVGGCLAFKEKLENQSEDIKNCRAKNEEEARAFMDKLSERGEQEKDALRESLMSMFKDIIDELGLATKEDIAVLRKDVAALKKSLEK